MIRKLYSDFIKDKIRKKKFKWIFKRSIQYFLIQGSFVIGRPLCGPILGTLLTNYRCNYHCKMCDLPLRDEQFRKKGLKELSTAGLKMVIKDFAELGISGIGFTGGEPLLRSDIFELLKYTKDLGMIAHLNTNGFFLNKENIQKIIDSGTDSINISLDGAKAQTHDAIRGYSGSFDRIIKAVECINAMRKISGVPIRLKLVSVIDKSNVDEVPDLVKLSLSLKTDSIEFMPQQPFYYPYKLRTTDYDDNFFEKLNKAINYLKDCTRKGIKIENSLRHLELFEKSFKNEKCPIRCYAAYNSYTVDCYGEIYPCLSFLNWGKSVGNIGQTSLNDFWYSRTYNKIRKSVSECKDCYLNCHAELNLLFDIFRS